MSAVTTILQTQNTTSGSDGPAGRRRRQAVLLPVVGTDSAGHSGVRGIWDQPVEALIGEKADLLPIRARHVATAGVEVAQQDNVLPTVRAKVSQPLSTFSRKRPDSETDVGAPARTDISDHIVQSIHFLHGRVWRGVLRNQSKAGGGCKTARTFLTSTQTKERHTLTKALS